MKWINGYTWDIEYKRLTNWHPWFAWYPVTAGVTEEGRKIKVWWEEVLRIGIFHPGWCDIPAYFSWEYKEKGVPT